MTHDTGTHSLMRIFIDESDRLDGKPLYMCLVNELHNLGCAGTTVFKGIEGFGTHRELHAARAFDYSSNMPVLIEVIDSRQKISEAVPLLREMVAEGLITIEQIDVTPVGIDHE